MDQLPVLMTDIKNLKRRDPKLVRYEQLDWMEVESDREIPISPDGEKMMSKNFRIDVFKRRLLFVMPDGPLLRDG